MNAAEAQRTPEDALISVVMNNRLSDYKTAEWIKDWAINQSESFPWGFLLRLNNDGKLLYQVAVFNNKPDTACRLCDISLDYIKTHPDIRALLSQRAQQQPESGLTGLLELLSNIEYTEKIILAQEEYTQSRQKPTDSISGKICGSCRTVIKKFSRRQGSYQRRLDGSYFPACKSCSNNIKKCGSCHICDQAFTPEDGHLMYCLKCGASIRTKP